MRLSGTGKGKGCRMLGKPARTIRVPASICGTASEMSQRLRSCHCRTSRSAPPARARDVNRVSIVVLHDGCYHHRCVRFLSFTGRVPGGVLRCEAQNAQMIQPWNSTVTPQVAVFSALNRSCYSDAAIRCKTPPGAWLLTTPWLPARGRAHLGLRHNLFVLPSSLVDCRFTAACICQSQRIIGSP